MKAIVLAIIIALATVMPGTISSGQDFVAPPQAVAQQVQYSDLEQSLHVMYESAWERATQYTDLQPEEMLKFPEDSVHWLMKKELQSMNQNVSIGFWNTDIFKVGTSRVLAWYKTDAGIRIEKGISLPVNARIEMLVTMREIKLNRYAAEGVLVHEMIHYIHHMRVMNQKGWMTIWPGNGHNYMAHLKYVEGYEFPANKY